MVTTEQQVTHPPIKEAQPVIDVEALRGWHLANQAAKRHNRNLLQYGAGLAAMLGINAGTGGMLALAESLSIRSAIASDESIGEPIGKAMWQLSSLAEWIVAITAVAILLLLFLVVTAYRARQTAERRADAHVERLIAMAPQWFRPGAE